MIGLPLSRACGMMSAQPIFAPRSGLGGEVFYLAIPPGGTSRITARPSEPTQAANTV